MADRSVDHSPKLVENLKLLNFRSNSGLLDISDLAISSTEPQVNGEKTTGVEKLRPDNSYVSEVVSDNARGPASPELQDVNSPCLVTEVSKVLRRNRVISNKCKVYVGNISYRTKTRELKEFCSVFGKIIHVQIIQDRLKKRSRGFGFVTFSNEWEADKAKQSSDDERTLDNRVMSVVPPTRKKKGSYSRIEETSLEEAIEQLRGLHNVTVIAQEELCTENTNKRQQADSVMVSSLNNDIMLHIFSYLCLRDRINLERVSCRWRLLAIKSWSSVSHLDVNGIFSLFKGGLTDDILLGLLRRGCQNLRSLDLSASPFLLTEFAVHCIAKHCKNLRELDLTGVEVSTASLRTLSKQCTLLERLKLRKCYKAGEKGFWWVFKQCVNLKHVDLAEGKRLSGQCFFMLPASIRSLNLQDCTRLSDAGLVHIGAKCKQLKSINISECASLTDYGILALTQSCSDIERLCFRRPPKEVSILGLAGIGNLTQLSELNLSRCEAVDDDLLYALGRSCIHLSELNIEACGGSITDAGLQSLVTCYQLKNLTISYLDKVTYSSLSHLAGNGSLETVTARACTGLSDEAVECLTERCPLLSRLDVSGCLDITNDCLQHFTVNCGSPERTPLIVVLGGTLVTEECLTITRLQCPRCEFDTHDLSAELLRTDRDPYLGNRSFFWEDDEEEDEDEDDEDEDDEDDELTDEDDTGVANNERLDYFLEADDPAFYMDELT